MFENLNNSNPASRQSVDDIFAETDQPGGGQASSNGSEITTRRVGVAAASTTGSEFVTEESSKKGGKGFKIAVIGMVVVIVGLLGFLAYSKFFKAEQIVETPVVPTTTKKPAEDVVSPATTTPIKEEPAFTTEIPVVPLGESATTTDLTPAEVSASSSATILTLDADKDLLTDDEELVLGTNLNVADTDKDGLSDYEEVKIYKTNPLKADTDGDTYPDGEEVKNGYNPNGAGKLPGNA